MKRKIFKVEVLFILVLIVILIFVLFIKPFIGLGDNGDFFRIIQSNGLYYLPQDFSDRHFGYFNRLYGIRQYASDGSQNFLSTQSIFIKFSIFLNKLFLSKKIFDIRFLALTYSLLFICSMYIILKYNMPSNRILKWFMAVILILIFGDIGYISYFNSFYGEASSYVSLFMTLGVLSILSVKKPRILYIVFFTVCALIFTGTKEQNSPTGILFALIIFRYFKFRKDLKWKTAISVSCILLVLMCGTVFISISPEIKYINQYQAITLGVLKDSKNPGEDLEELGIDRKFSILKGTSYYDPYPVIIPNSKLMIKEFYSKYSFMKIVMFYMRHPDRFIRELTVASNDGFYIKPEYVGNYEKSEKKGYGAKTNVLCLWSNIKENKLPHTLRFVVVFYISFIIGSIVVYVMDRRRAVRLKIEILWLVVLIGTSQVVTSLIGDGEADIEKHLFLFNVSFDILFAVILLFFLNYILNAISKLKGENKWTNIVKK